MWLLLDEEPVVFHGPVELRYVPKALETFAFAGEERRDGRAAMPWHTAMSPSREPGAPVPRSNPGYGQQFERRGFRPARQVR